MITYKFVKGKDVPAEARELSRGDDGLMQGWYDRERDHMVAMLAYDGTRLVGWCAAVRIIEYFFVFFDRYSDDVKISTFVHDEYRRQGIGKRLLERTTRAVRLANPRAVIRYGAPEDAEFFNKTYDTTINAHGLTPDKYYA